MRPIHRIRDEEGIPVSPARVLRAYMERCFPMADHRDGKIFWVRPTERALITWYGYRVPRSLRRTARKTSLRFTTDVAFGAVIEACANRHETWISHDIEELFRQLHLLGLAHSVEAWDDTGRLVGGVYGLSVGGIFAGESMFHLETGAGKLCVMALIQHLQALGYSGLDCQQQTPHMEMFGAELIRDEFYAMMVASSTP
ncbi:MAG: leucyl/phenylalanyl-tRNA--protein transferase, partial [Planctomycetota bacterium]